MISAFTNTLKIPELRQRIFFTLALIVVVRIGAAITLPGVNATSLQNWVKDVADDSEKAQVMSKVFLDVVAKFDRSVPLSN